MARHTMTPARRAALRKAQLASARARRKNTTRKAISRSVHQSASSAKASGSLAGRSAVKRFNSPANKARRRKIAKGVVIAAAVGTVAATSVHGAKHSPTIRKARSNRAYDRHVKRTYKPSTYSAQFGKPRVSSTVRTTRTGAGQKALTGSATRSLGMGPKGKAAVKGRATKARRRQMRSDYTAARRRSGYRN